MGVLQCRALECPQSPHLSGTPRGGLRDVSRVGAKALPEDLHHSPAHAPLESVPLPVVWALG